MVAKGSCDFIRFQRGTLLDATWQTEEWGRIQAGRLRGPTSAAALWDFNDSLEDSSQGLWLSEPVAAITYAQGWPYCVAPVTYPFAVNYTYDYKVTPIGGDSLVRGFQSGAAFSYPAPRKDSWELPFVGITMAQYSAFKAAYEGCEVMELWLDSAKEKTALVYFDPQSPPVLEGKPYWRNGVLVVNMTLYLVEA